MINSKETVESNLKEGQLLITEIERGQIGGLAGPIKIFRWSYAVFSWKPKVMFGALILGFLFCLFAVGDFISAQSVESKIEEKFSQIDANSRTKLIADIAWEKALAYQEIGHPDRIREKARNGLSIGFWILLPSLFFVFGSKWYLKTLDRYKKSDLT